jgi:FlaG/FlaF family flagellin (archaellin)
MAEETPNSGAETRTILLVTLGVVVVSATVAFGFSALSTNPLSPDATFELSDADDEFRLNQTGTVRILTITHVEGESIPLTQIEIVAGSRSSGLVFSEATNWSAASGSVTYRTLSGDVPLRNDTDAGTFGSGETLTIAKTDGVVSNPVANGTIQVRLFHTPSQTVITNEEVDVR